MCEQMEIDDKRIGEMVKEWFKKTARSEWRRLRQDPYHKIEFIVTMHFLEEYLPKRSLVLDAGAGPGRYTIELAKRGYDVVLLDLVPEMLELAKKKVRRAGELNKWLKMVFILVFEFRRCFRLFCTQACSSSHEMAPMVQKMKHPDNLLRNLKKRRLTSNYMSVKTHNDQ